VLLSLPPAGLDQTIVSTAGPAIQRDLAMAAGALPVAHDGVPRRVHGHGAHLRQAVRHLRAAAGAAHGHRRLPLRLGALRLSPTTPALIAARAVQGLGAAGLFTSAFAVIADIFPPAVRGKYTGLVGAVFGVASVVGPLVGGFLTDGFGWHWVFFVNVPLGAVAVWFVAARMPPLGGRPGEKPRLDLAGAFWLVVAVVPLLLALSVGHDEGGAGAGGAPAGRRRSASACSACRSPAPCCSCAPSAARPTRWSTCASSAAAWSRSASRPPSCSARAS
jgi:MFS family permease